VFLYARLLVAHKTWMASTSFRLYVVVSQLESGHGDVREMCPSTYRAVIHHHKWLSAQVMMHLADKPKITHT
jgi:hypothetical protein